LLVQRSAAHVRREGAGCIGGEQSIECTLSA
jgi:hypothetical protein